MWRSEWVGRSASSDVPLASWPARDGSVGSAPAPAPTGAVGHTGAPCERSGSVGAVGEIILILGMGEKV